MESVFGIFVLMFLALGTIQVALTLYARNVVQAAVHDGARAVVEIGGVGPDAEAVARRVIQRSAGSLVDRLSIGVATAERADRLQVIVVAAGKLDAPGPIPISVPFSVESSSSREIFDVSR